MPDEERAEQQGQQQARTASVPDSERTIRKVGQRRADRGGGDDGRPVQEGMEALALTCATTAARKIAAKMPVPTR
jgi:hypothetical protein